VQKKALCLPSTLRGQTQRLCCFDSTLYDFDILVNMRAGRVSATICRICPPTSDIGPKGCFAGRVWSKVNSMDAMFAFPSIRWIKQKVRGTMQYLGYIFVFLFNLFGLFSSIMLILIGKNVVRHPKYTTDKKRKFCFIFGLICVVPLTITQIFFSIGIYYVIIILTRSAN